VAKWDAKTRCPQGGRKESDAEFDRYARDYDELLRTSARERFVQDTRFYHLRKWSLLQDFFRKRSLDTSTMSWLDVGCGRGELLICGASSFRRVVGCDPSEGMLRDARGIEIFLQKEPSVLPFASENFDFVTAVCVYHHVAKPDRIPLTREVERVLRPNGVFCLIEHNPFNPVTQHIVRTCPIDVDARLLTPGSARRYLRAAGLKHMATEYFLFLPQKMYEIMRGVESAIKRFPMGGQYATFARK
jgi:SAM-dependent methyltransferase